MRTCHGLQSIWSVNFSHWLFPVCTNFFIGVQLSHVLWVEICNYISQIKGLSIKIGGEDTGAFILLKMWGSTWQRSDQRHFIAKHRIYIQNSVIFSWISRPLSTFMFLSFSLFIFYNLLFNLFNGLFNVIFAILNFKKLHGCQNQYLIMASFLKNGHILKSDTRAPRYACLKFFIIFRLLSEDIASLALSFALASPVYERCLR